MRTATLLWKDGAWSPPPAWAGSAQLVLVFGEGARLADARLRSDLQALTPRAERVGCSTAGDIAGETVSDDGAVALLVAFASTRVRTARREVTQPGDSRAAGEALARELAAPDLRHVLVLSDGLHIDGATLAEGLRAGLPAGVKATGGLAGDGPRFAQTLVQHDDFVGPRAVVAVGLYGPDLEVSWGSAGGWHAFGPRRLVTRAVGNVLYELDGQPALALYKTYLGDRAAGLPATGLLFPLELLPETEGEPSVVRTILAVDEDRQSLTFAGNVPQGRQVRLTKLTVDRLIRAAEEAGGSAATSCRHELALLVSCVGRRLLLDQRVEEELEAVVAELGRPPGVAGFYSYGEIGPAGFAHSCDLHNQTLTFTTFGERTH